MEIETEITEEELLTIYRSICFYRNYLIEHRNYGKCYRLQDICNSLHIEKKIDEIFK